jgi:dihydroxy-acid dehydratase
LQDGDELLIDAQRRVIDFSGKTEAEAEELLAQRRARWVQPPPRPAAARGVLAKYARSVTSASEGCITDAPSEARV